MQLKQPHARWAVGGTLTLTVAAIVGLVTYALLTLVFPSPRSDAATTYVVSEVHQVLNPTNPTYIDTLTFNVTPRIPTAEGRVVVSVDVGLGGPTYACRPGARGDSVTCSTTVPHLTVDQLTRLDLVVIR
jgi:hypothetical protein